MLKDLSLLKESHTEWLHERLPSQSRAREEKWSASIAGGGKKFVTNIKKLLGMKATGRRVVGMEGSGELREPSAPYSVNFVGENDRLRGKNMHIWGIYHGNTEV
ncbi:MAG: hypothetical protein OEY01_16595 [Desulfobulbaceae bacterium]|nr:hypothetical protein [Desulfobulbaceae bacterium]